MAQKGACSLATAGTAVSPPIVSICLHAMWSMGQVKEHYLHYEKAGNQYLGRVVAGLNCSDPTFAVLPPYFDFSSCTTNPEEAEKDVDDLILSHLVCGNEVNPRLF